MIWTITNLILCAWIFCICVERLRVTSHRTFWMVRWGLALLGTGAIAWAVSPIFWPLMTPPLMVLFSFGVVVELMSHSPLWKDGAPRHLHWGDERRTGNNRRN